MCARCRRRYLAGNSLDCAECESTLASDTERDARDAIAETVQRSCAGSGSDRCDRPAGPEDVGNADTAPSLVSDVVASTGRPLQSGVRAEMEARFGRSFGDVRVHTGARASKSAREIGAAAYTLGRNVVFDGDSYDPSTTTGKRLLAHELVHVLQQGRTRVPTEGRPAVSPSDTRAEREGDRLADAVLGGSPHTVPGRRSDGGTVTPRHAPAGDASVLHRKLQVDDPGGRPAGSPAGVTNESIVRQYVRTLCSSFTVTGGEVVPATAGFCVTSSPPRATESCGCLCEFHTLTDSSGSPVVWSIDVANDDWPHTDPSTRTVTVHSPGSGVEFGAWTKPTGSSPARRGTTPNWLVLAHELCGHALPIEKGTHPTGPPPTHGGRPRHDFTVKIQNRIAREHGIPESQLRGLFSDPHHGESLASVTVAEFGFGSANPTSVPPEQQLQIQLAHRFIDSAPVKMDVIGHADHAGATPAENRRLSKQRAENVKAELVSRGVDPGRFLQVTGVGATDCPASGRMPACRKVEIYMYVYEGASGSHSP